MKLLSTVTGYKKKTNRDLKCTRFKKLNSRIEQYRLQQTQHFYKMDTDKLNNKLQTEKQKTNQKYRKKC